jgi:D-amino-acid dehydrogenase
MKTIVLGAGVVGTATAYFLARNGHEVEVIERQAGAALETSFGNGGVLHAAEVEPWSQPGMPTKILKWLGQEDAPLLVRYGAIPKMWWWGLKFIANCTAERFERNSLTNLKIALHSLQVVKQIRGEIALDYDMRTNGMLKVYTSQESFDASSRSAELFAQHDLPFKSLSPQECAALEPSLRPTMSSLVGGLHFPSDEAGDCHKFTAGLAAAAEKLGARFSYGTQIQRLEASRGKVSAVHTSRGPRKADNFVAALASYTPLVLKSVGVKVPIYPVRASPSRSPAKHGRIGRKCRLPMTGGFSGWSRSAIGCASQAPPRSRPMTRRRAAHAVRRSSTTSSACFPISPNATTRRPPSSGRASGR